MPTSDPVDILLTHNQWANRQLIAACEKLSDEQFHQQFEIGCGSLHDTVTHLAASTQAWGDLLAGREQRPRLEGTRRSMSELSAMLDEVAADLTKAAKAHPVEEIVVGSRGGKTYSFTRGAVITHVTTHGMHHRAQALNMLRRLGVSPLPPSSVLEWTQMAD